MPRQTSEEQPNHRQLDQCFARLDFSFVIFTHSPVARNPTERALHYPSPGQNTEATRAWRALDHFEIPATLRLAPGSQLLPTVRCISPDFFEAGEDWGKSSEQAPSTFAIMQIGRGHVARSAASQGCPLEYDVCVL
jgi:hypothetical protein